MGAMAEAARAEAERLARLAHEETGFGNTKDKTAKNLFSAVDVYDYIRPLRTVGILREDPHGPERDRGAAVDVENSKNSDIALDRGGRRPNLASAR